MILLQPSSHAAMLPGATLRAVDDLSTVKFASNVHPALRQVGGHVFYQLTCLRNESAKCYLEVVVEFGVDSNRAESTLSAFPICLKII